MDLFDRQQSRPPPRDRGRPQTRRHGQTPGERDNAGDLFIHSQKLVVIDQAGRIRGYFDGETAEGASPGPGRRQNPGPPMNAGGLQP
jgi:hypothetical protein